MQYHIAFGNLLDIQCFHAKIKDISLLIKKEKIIKVKQQPRENTFQICINLHNTKYNIFINFERHNISFVFFFFYLE